MRKTVTSCEVKDRWNRKHYDQIMFRTGKGGAEAVKAMAAFHGLSVAEYIRHLIIADAENEGKHDISAIIGGGGDLNEFFAQFANGQMLIPDYELDYVYDGMPSNWDSIPDDNPGENYDSPQYT